MAKDVFDDDLDALLTDAVDEEGKQPIARRHKMGAKAPKPEVPEGYAKIILENSANIGPSGHPVGLNGRFYLIKPGVEVVVPGGILEVLEHAIHTEAITDGNGSVIGSRDTHRLPFRVLVDNR